MHILIADDHAVVRRGLKEILADALPGADFSEAGNGDEVLSQLGNPQLPCWCWISICLGAAGWTCCGM